MEWNNLLTDLNYYLADMFEDDNQYIEAKRIIRITKYRPTNISAFILKGDNEWFKILSYYARKDKVTDLLKAILEIPGNEDDEFLKGAIKNLEDNNVISDGKKVQTKDWHEAGETIKEKIISKKSTILPIGFLKRGVSVARAVVRIIVDNKVGTGFVIQNNWLVTNHHVLPDIETAKNARIEFNFEFPPDLEENKIMDLKAEKVVILNPGNSKEDKLFFTVDKEDYTIVKIAEDVSSWGYLKLNRNGVAKEDFVNIIQHPSGGPKQIAIYNNVVMYVDTKEEGFIVQYLTDTMPGSSGSPVFNSQWEVVAIHHSGGWVKDPSINAAVYRNQGTNIKRITARIDAERLFES